MKISHRVNAKQFGLLFAPPGIVVIMRRSLVAVVVLVIMYLGSSEGSPLFVLGKQEGGGLLGKVSALKQTVYEKKREFLNGVNEKVSKMLWIPPYPSSTTEETPATVLPQLDPISETPSIWWWQTTVKPSTSTVATVQPLSDPIVIDLPTYAPIVSTTNSPSTSSTIRNSSNNDRLVVTVADTNELEIPNVFMYARSSFIPPELRLTDSVEYDGPVVGRGPPPQDHRSSRLIVV